jgi:hypothetical protein
MVPIQKFSVAFSLMVIANELLELAVCNLMWTYIVNIATLCNRNTVSMLTFKTMITVQIFEVMSDSVRKTEIK